MRLAYSELFHKVERPFLLYLALLLHDVGKAAPEAKHTDASVQMALRAARRLRLDAAATHTLEVLIKHHLLLASISQRRDLDDPAVIRHVARLVENPENLALLTLHTFVDSQATSDKLWNGFKDSLLWTLHQKTMHLLTGGPGLARVEEQQRGQMREQVQKVLKEPISSEEMEAHFQTLPPRYFQVHSPKEVADDLAVAHEFMRLQITEDAEGGLNPIVRWRDDQDRACNTVKVSTWDRAGLFNKVAGCFSAVGLSILSAQVFTRRDGIVLDTFSVVDARTGSLAGVEQRKRFQELLQRVLLGADTDLDALIARQKTSSRSLADAYAGDRLGTEIRFDNEASDDRSLVEIQTKTGWGCCTPFPRRSASLRSILRAQDLHRKRRGNRHVLSPRTGRTKSRQQRTPARHRTPPPRRDQPPGGVILPPSSFRSWSAARKRRWLRGGARATLSVPGCLIE